MKDMLAIFRREFVARRDLLLLAAAVLLIAVMMPLVPGTGQYSASDVWSLAAQVLAFGLGCCVAIGLGISVFGTDLSAGRLGFYFARPVTARAIWTGKILAALTIVFACEVVVIIPALVAEGSNLVHINVQGWLAISCTFLLLPVLLLLWSHAVGIMNRARSAWLVLDLVGLVACAVGSWIMIRPLYVLGAARAVLVVGGLLAISVVVALALAGCAGLALGRTDLRRTHGAMSLVLWVLAGAAVAGLATYSTWLRTFEASAMDEVEVFSVSPDGRWVEVWGSAPRHLDIRRRVLVSTTSGRSVQLPESWVAYPAELVYARDGARAIGFDRGRGSENLSSMWWLDLGAEAPEAVWTSLVVPPRTIPALSADGSRVAFLEDGTLSVYDLASEQLVAAIRLPAAFRKATILFLENDALRLIARSGDGLSSQLRIGEVDLATDEVRETGRVDGLDGSSWLALDAHAKRMILSLRKDRASVTTRSLRDARDGTLIREFDRRGTPRFLTDGRLVSLMDDPGGETRLVVESPDGVAMAEQPLGRADWESLGGEALPGQVVVGRLESLDERDEGRRYDLIDVDSGAVRPIDGGLRWAHNGFQWVWGGGGMIWWSVDAPRANRIFIDRTGAVVRWDPETGEMVHVVGGSSE